MDIQERVIKMIRNRDKEALGTSLLQKTGLFCWETGLGPVINALPGVFGQQAVLYFPGRSGKYCFPCHEADGKVLLAVTAGEMETLRPNLLQNPGVEIWLKDGWYAGTVRLLTAEEQAEIIGKITDKQFFGEAGQSLAKRSLQEFSLLEADRSAPCTGSSGPGSKAWIWTLAALFLFFSKKNKKS